MKKLVIVLLAVMLVFSLTSCKDKGEEVIETYEKFCSTVTLGGYVKDSLGSSKGDIQEQNASDISTIISHASGSVIEIADDGITKQTGTVEVTSSDDASNKTTVTWKDVVIDYKFTEGSDTTEKDGQLTISGTYEHEYVLDESASRAISKSTTYRYNFTINSTSYSASYTRNSDGTYSMANVDGKDVNLRILNAGK